jgi:hypothetical protein
MKLYETRTGEIVGTQAEAKASGRGWQQVEVPTDKPGLIAYLNNNRHIPCDLPHETTERLPAPPVGSGSAECDKCKWTPKARQQYSERIARDLTTDAMVSYIENADAALLARLAENVCWRIKELTSEVRKLLPQPAYRLSDD